MSDKRTVTTDALETLGTIITDQEKRDAIHLAVEPIVAVEKLYPGQDVGLKNGGAGVTNNPVGIVDPFLKAAVLPGERFWLVVYPRQIESLRHVWSHPAFNDPAEKTVTGKVDSEAWLRTFIERSDCPNYDTVMAAAVGDHVEGVESYGRAYENDGEYITFYGRDAHAEIPPQFWDHVEIVTGKKIPQELRASSFSCSC